MKVADNRKLIFDLGLHLGEDTTYYLHQGHRVVAVDADPNMVKRAKKIFKQAIRDGRLVVLNYAVTSKNGEKIKLNISEWTYWTSLKKEIANRGSKLQESIEVPTIRLDTLINKCGEPYYCKIDLEGYDAIAIKTLSTLPSKPKYISVETECLGEYQSPRLSQITETLDALHDLGYKKFKLVDQTTLTVLDKKKPFYVKPEAMTIVQKVLAKRGKLNTYYINPKRETRKLKNLYNFDFTNSSGPFGKDLRGKWSDYGQAKELILYHRKIFFQQKNVKKYAFWCDWHATK